MNRYGGRGPTIGAPSKATATTTCQKCLKKGHYSYECKAVAQERPYVSRPSRTQQMLNPKLMPKLSSEVPQDLLRKTGVADEQLAKAELERGRKRDRQSEDLEDSGAPKRRRSLSSESVSTISTRSSHSRPPGQKSKLGTSRRSMSQSRSASRSVSRSPTPERSLRNPATEKKRRRGSSVSSTRSYSSRSVQGERADTSGKDISSRNTRRRYSSHSPPARGRVPRAVSRSPSRPRRRLSNDRRQWDGKVGQSRERAPNSDMSRQDNTNTARGNPRERSLSPFSKRLALTQAMNTR